MGNLSKAYKAYKAAPTSKAVSAALVGSSRKANPTRRAFLKRMLASAVAEGNAPVAAEGLTRATAAVAGTVGAAAQKTAPLTRREALKRGGTVTAASAAGIHAATKKARAAKKANGNIVDNVTSRITSAGEAAAGKPANTNAELAGKLRNELTRRMTMKERARNTGGALKLLTRKIPMDLLGTTVPWAASKLTKTAGDLKVQAESIYKHKLPNSLGGGAGYVASSTKQPDKEYGRMNAEYFAVLDDISNGKVKDTAGLHKRMKRIVLNAKKYYTPKTKMAGLPRHLANIAKKDFPTFKRGISGYRDSGYMRQVVNRHKAGKEPGLFGGKSNASNAIAGGDYKKEELLRAKELGIGDSKRKTDKVIAAQGRRRRKAKLKRIKAKAAKRRAAQVERLRSAYQK
jgi:hypothetical protein